MRAVLSRSAHTHSLTIAHVLRMTFSWVSFYNEHADSIDDIPEPFWHLQGTVSHRPLLDMASRGKRKSAQTADEVKTTGKRQVSLVSRVQTKLRDSFGHLNSFEQSVLLDEATGLSLRDRLARDIKMKDEKPSSVTFGKWYNMELTQIYRSPESIHGKLKPPPSVIPVDERLVQAMAHAFIFGLFLWHVSG